MTTVSQHAASVWERFSHFATEIRESDFMAEMSRHNCATLCGLTRWRRPAVVVESGGYLGMSAAFILKALADEGLIKNDELPPRIDMFLHDSFHRYRHMLWEFRQFWKRLGDGGLLFSHDVHYKAAFAEFVVKTHARDRKGILDSQRTTHYDWGRWATSGLSSRKQLEPNTLSLPCR